MPAYFPLADTHARGGKQGCRARLAQIARQFRSFLTILLRPFGRRTRCGLHAKPPRPFTDSQAISFMSSYSVRPATARDAKAIAEIHVATWKSAYADLMPADYLSQNTVEKRLAYWREAIEFSDPQLLVATEDDKVVGFVGFDRSRDAGSRATVGEIWAIYVAPTHWAQGIGLALWDGAREGLKDEGCTQVTVWVLLRNERALSFMEHGAGFKREMPSLKTVAFGSVKLEEIRLKRAVD